MENSEKLFPDYTDEEIETIIQKVEAAKPWSGFLRSFEMFLLSLYSNTIFTFLGFHLSYFLGIFYPELIKSYSLMFSVSHLPIFLCLPVMAVFIGLDIYFYLKPSKIDKMSVRDWCEVILKNQVDSFGNLKLYICSYAVFLLYFLICIFFESSDLLKLSKNIIIVMLIFIYKNNFWITVFYQSSFSKKMKIFEGCLNSYTLTSPFGSFNYTLIFPSVCYFLSSISLLIILEKKINAGITLVFYEPITIIYSVTMFLLICIISLKRIFKVTRIYQSLQEITTSFNKK